MTHFLKNKVMNAIVLNLGFIIFIYCFNIYLQINKQSVVNLHILNNVIKIATENTFKGYITYITLLVFNFITLFIQYRNFRYKYLPHAFSFYITESSAHLGRTKKFFDKLVNKRNNHLIYKNKMYIDFKRYVEYKEEIMQFLHIDNLKLRRIGKNKIELYLDDPLAEKFNFSTKKLRVGYLYLGNSYDGDFYIKIGSEELTHSVFVGESGSGKSNVLNVLMASLIYNRAMITKMFLIDFKIVELKRYADLDTVEFITDLEGTIQALEYLHQEMIKRRDFLIKKKDVKFTNKDFIFLIIDEFSTLKNNTDKKAAERIEYLLTDLGQKARFVNIRIMLFGQKIDTKNISSNVLNNIQTKVLMKTDNSDNISKIIKVEDLKEIDINPREFEAGRMLYIDGMTSKKTEAQSPFVKSDDYLNVEHS